MLPLLVLLFVGAIVDGQQHSRARQGFRPRGFVPQSAARYPPAYQPQGTEPHPHQIPSRGPRHDPEPVRQSHPWPEESPQPFKTHNKRQKPWEDTAEKTRTNIDDEQWHQETVEDRQTYKYPSFKSQSPSFSKPFTTPIPIIRLDKEQSLDGSYKSSYETGNSIIHEETGFMKPMDGPEDMLVQQGSYSYTDDDGNVFTVRYTADDQGFRAHGDHFPTPPPIPPEIQRGLDIIYEQIRIDAERKKYDEEENGLDHSGQYSTNVEHRTPYKKTNQEQRESRFRNSNTQNEQTQNFNRNTLPQEQTQNFNRNNVPQEQTQNFIRNTVPQEQTQNFNRNTVPQEQTQNFNRNTVPQEQTQNFNRNNVPQEQTQNFNRNTVSQEQVGVFHRFSNTRRERSNYNTKTNYHNEQLPNHGEVRNYPNEHMSDYDK